MSLHDGTTTVRRRQQSARSSGIAERHRRHPGDAGEYPADDAPRHHSIRPERRFYCLASRNCFPGRKNGAVPYDTRSGEDGGRSRKTVSNQAIVSYLLAPRPALFPTPAAAFTNPPRIPPSGSNPVPLPGKNGIPEVGDNTACDRPRHNSPGERRNYGLSCRSFQARGGRSLGRPNYLMPDGGGLPLFGPARKTSFPAKIRRHTISGRFRPERKLPPAFLNGIRAPRDGASACGPGAGCSAPLRWRPARRS